MKIKLILFDVAGVLFPANMVVGEYLEAKLHISQSEQAVMWQGIHKQFSAGKMNTTEFLEAFARLYNLPQSQVTKDLFVLPFDKALVPMPGIGAILEKLSRKDITLAILSDTNEMFAHARSRLDYAKYFDKQFLSFETGFIKPDPRAYQIVIDYYKIQPEEILFIDDRLGNVDAAIEIGINAVVFTNSSKLEQELKKYKIL